MPEKTCPCGIDHWLWAATGLAGIRGMLALLASQGIPASPAALEKLKTELATLNQLASTAERKHEQ